MKKILIITALIILILSICTITYARVGGVRSSVHSTHSTRTSTPKSTTKIKSPKTYTTTKNFTSKYNASNIKTNKVNDNPTNYTKFSATNIFRPNFWTAMWAFQCFNNKEEVTEQDIAKELEERGYSQEEIKDILREGEQAKEEVEKKEKQNNKIIIICIIVIIILIVIGAILMCIY